jgi:hypothetical protein
MGESPDVIAKAPNIELPAEALTTLLQRYRTPTMVRDLPRVQREGTSLSAQNQLDNGLNGDRVRSLYTKPPTSGDVSPPLVENYGSLTPEKRSAVRNEVKQYGQTLPDLLPKLMRDNRVVAIGEGHSPEDAMRLKGPEMVRDLAAAGATHLAVEMPESLQPVLDKFMATGVLDEDKIPILDRNPGYINILKAARDAHLKLVAVDSDSEYQVPHTSRDANGMLRDLNPEAAARFEEIWRIRNSTMAVDIENILDTDPKAKVVFWVGATHLNDFVRLGKGHPTSAAELIHERYSMPTIATEESWTRIGRAVHGLDRPKAVSTSDAPVLGSLKDAEFDPTKRFDYLVFFPTSKK